MDTEKAKLYIIESGKPLDMVKKYIADMDRARLVKLQIMAQLGFDPKVVEVWSSKHDGSMSSLSLWKNTKLPKNFVDANWTKADRQGRRHPKRGTPEHKIFYAPEASYAPQESVIVDAYKVPTQINYKIARGSGSTAIGRIMNACGFLWLNIDDGPYAMWTPDVEEIVKDFYEYHKKDKGFEITNTDVLSWKMPLEGLRPILEEEWDVMIAQAALETKRKALQGQEGKVTA